MENSSDGIQNLLIKAESSINKTAQLQQVLAQLEANLSREENQKVVKSQKKTQSLCQEVSNL